MGAIWSRHSRLLAAIAAGGVLVLAGCGSSSSGGKAAGGGQAPNGSQSSTAGAYGSLPAESGTPQSGGTITLPVEAGTQPNYIFPVTPGQFLTTDTAAWQEYMFRPLYWAGIGNKQVLNPDLSLAQFPVYSDGNKTVTVNMKTNYRWSDGHPVTSQDDEFFIDLLEAAVKESAANFGDYTPGDFPDNIASMSTPTPQQLVLHLKQAYNTDWFTDTQLNLITPLPSTTWAKASTNGPQLDYTNPANAKKIYDYLAAQAKSLSTYASNPLWQDVDGPFKLTSFNSTNDGYTMVPNPTYGGPQKARFSKLVGQYFASTTAEFNALRAGKLDVGRVHSQDIPQVPILKRLGYNIFGYPDLGFYYMTFNFADTTNNWNKIIGQLYIRQALAHLQDEAAVIKGGFDNAATPAYGPINAMPYTPYVPSNATTDPYPFSVSAASQLLSSHGWKVSPDGTTTCQSPGSGASQCGAGIPKGQNLNFSLIYANDPPVDGQEVSQLASAGKQVGINITPVAKTFNFILQTYDDKGHPENKNKWQMLNFGGYTTSIYPTTEDIFNTTGSFNAGDYSDKQADALIKASEFSNNSSAVKNEAGYLTQNLPGLFTPNEDRIWAWKGISGPPDSFAALTQEAYLPEYWYVTK